MKERKLDIRELLQQASRSQYGYFSNLPNDAKKEFAPRVAMRWLSVGNKSPAAQIKMVNETVNPYLDAMGDHPELIYRLMCATNPYGQTNGWVAAPKANMTKDILAMFLWQIYEDHHYAEMVRLANRITEEELKIAFDTIGADDDERKEVTKAWKKRNR